MTDVTQLPREQGSEDGGEVQLDGSIVYPPTEGSVRYTATLTEDQGLVPDPIDEDEDDLDEEDEE